MSSPNPYESPATSNPFSELPNGLDPAIVEAAAKRLLSEQHDKTIAWQLFLTGLFGCLAPIFAIYGIVFLARRPYPFPLKYLAIAGTVLHCLWTLSMIVAIFVTQLVEH